MTVTGLSASTTYYFALKTADEVPNWSALSNNPSGTTSAPPDTTAPAAISSLAVTGTTSTTASLSWTAPGDDGSTGTATTYDIRRSTSPITTDAAFAAATPISGEPAPAPAATLHAMTVTGLSASTTYYFAIKTADEVPNWSALSNNPSGTTSAAPDTTAPAAITSLAVTGTTSTTATLSWTAPGDDGSAGTATTYDIRRATSP